MTITFDKLHIGLAAFLLVFIARYFWDRWQKTRLHARVRVLEEELARSKAPNDIDKNEYRVERFEVAWFPTVTSSRSQKAITQVAAGVPYCGKCVAALSLKGSDWVCPKCDAKYPGSLADITIADSVCGVAVRYFNERHPGYKQPSKK